MRKELELYEILFLLHPNFTEKEIADKIQFYQDFLTAKATQFKSLKQQILFKWYF